MTVTLPAGLLADDRGALALADRRLVLVGELDAGDGTYATCLVWVDAATRATAVDELGEVSFGRHAVTIIADRDSVLLFRAPDQAERRAGPGDVTAVLAVDGAAALRAGDGPVRLFGTASTADRGDWLVVLGHDVLVQEPRYVARLTLDGERLRWGAVVTPDAADFPVDRFGLDDVAADRDAHVTVGAALRRGGRSWITSEGSDAGSVPRYGADFFSCAEVDDDGRAIRRIAEVSGWKRGPGKRGVRSKFTGDGDYAVLTPVFGSGPWRGRSRVVRLSDGAAFEPYPPRGWTRARVLDRNGGLWWLRRDDAVAAVPHLELRPVELD